MCLGGSRFGIDLLGPNVTSSCGRWLIIDVSLERTFKREDSKGLLFVIFVVK